MLAESIIHVQHRGFVYTREVEGRKDAAVDRKEVVQSIWCGLLDFSVEMVVSNLFRWEGQ